MFNAFALQLGLDVTIIQMRRIGTIELQFNRNNHIFIFPFILKFTIAVSVLTISIGKGHLMTCGYFYGSDGLDKVLYLTTISTNILHCSCSNGARNEGKIFQSVSFLLYASRHQIVPCYPTTRLYSSNTISYFNINELNSRVQNGPLKIFRKQQVTPLSQWHERFILWCQCG